MTAVPAGPTASTRDRSLKVALAYVLGAGAWLLFSDGALMWLFSAPETIQRVGVGKGWFFVLVTGSLLYGVLERVQAGGREAPAEVSGTSSGFPRRLVPLVFLGLVGMVPGMALSFHVAFQPRLQEAALEDLQGVARLKTAHLESWLRERRGDATALAADTAVRAFLAAGTAPDAAVATLAGHRLETLRDALGYASIRLANVAGHAVLATAGDVPSTAEEEALVLQAVGTRQSVRSGFLPDASHEVFLEFLVPVFPEGDEAAAPLGVAILRQSATRMLFPYVEQWPGASPSAETLLVMQQGESVIFLNGLRHRPNSALTEATNAFRQSPLVAAQAIRDGSAGTTAGLDYRGKDVLAAFRPVAGTPWFLVAKVDRAEVFGALHDSVYWITVMAFVGVAAILTALWRLWRETQRSQALAVQAGAARANLLLASVANASTDAIFAKDLEGRYILANTETSRVIGRPDRSVVGCTDLDLLPQENADALRANDAQVVSGNAVLTYEEQVHTPSGVRTYLATKGPLRDGQGHVTGIFGISRDITDRAREAEVERQQAAALQRRNEELDRFNRAAVGREMDMIQLKKRINTLSTRLGEAPPFPSQLDATATPGAQDG